MNIACTHIANTAFVIVTVFGLITFSGCDSSGEQSQASSDYTTLKTQLLNEALNAMASQSPQQSLQKIERLASAYPNASFIKEAREYELKRKQRRQLNRELKAGDIAAADDKAQEYKIMTSKNNEIKAINKKLDSVKALKRYLEQKPYPDPEEAENAIDELHSEGRDRPLRQFDFYTEWFQKEEASAIKSVRAIENNHPQKARRVLENAFADVSGIASKQRRRLLREAQRGENRALAKWWRLRLYAPPARAWDPVFHWYRLRTMLESG